MGTPCSPRRMSVKGLFILLRPEESCQAARRSRGCITTTLVRLLSLDSQDAQKVRPARPQRAKRRRRTLRYVELLSEARTPLADFFSILLTLLHVEQCQPSP